MERKTLTAMLNHLVKSGVLEQKNTRFSVQEGHRLTFYLGSSQSATLIHGVVEVLDDDGFLTLKKGETDEEVLVPDALVMAIARSAPSRGRAGF